MAERYIPEHRRTQFKAKNTFKPEELRRRREEQQVEIRKAKREENLAKRRGIGSGENRPGASLGAAPDSDDESAPTESQVRALSPLILCCFCHVFCCGGAAGFERWIRPLVSHLHCVACGVGEACAARPHTALQASSGPEARFTSLLSCFRLSALPLPLAIPDSVKMADRLSAVERGPSSDGPGCLLRPD